jgi:hypothetical protein
MREIRRTHVIAIEARFDKAVARAKPIVVGLARTAIMRPMGRQRSLPTIDVSPSDSDVEIVSNRVEPLVNRVRRPQGDGPSMAPFQLTRPTSERKFFTGGESAPDVEPEVDLLEAPPRRRSARSILSMLLFFVIVAAVLTLAACEISIAFKIPWLDPRPALFKIAHLAREKIAHRLGR